jgi:putative heme transporter
MSHARERSRPEVPPSLERAAAISWRVLVVVAAVAAVVFALVLLRVIVLPVIAALFLATLLVPLANRLRARGWGPLAATWTVFGSSLLVLAGLVMLFVPAIGRELDQVRTRAIEGVEEMQRYISRPPFNISEDDIDTFIDRAQQELRANSQGITSRVAAGAVVVGEIVTGSILTLVLLFFFIKDSESITNWLVELGGRHGRDLRAVGQRAAIAVNGYLRGVAIVGLVDGFFIGLGLVILRVPLALPLAFLTFVGAFLPLVGAFVAGALAALVALVTKGIVPALIVVAITVGVQQIEGHVLAPLVLGRAVKLHPIVILLALGAGAILGGVIGAFLAVPVAAVVTAVSGYLRGREPTEMAEEVAEREHPPPAEAG